MIIYVPVFQNGKRGFEVIETQKARYLKMPGYAAFIHYCGTLYNGEHLFIAKEGVAAYWNKEYNTMKEYRIEPNNPAVEWKTP